jgi:hypothetical protein
MVADFLAFVFSSRDPANRKDENKQVKMSGARSENTMIRGARVEA